MRFSLSLAVLLFASGCAGSAEVHYGASYATPDLIEVGPGVQVVADYDVPIFYSGGYYWRYDNGDWYRSNDYAGGFVYAAPPSAVRHIHEPERYVHYRPRGYVAHNRPERRPQPIMRDQRGPNPEIDEREQGEDRFEPHGERREGAPPPQRQQQPGNVPPPREELPPRPPTTRENLPSPPPQPRPPENMPPSPPPTRDNMPSPQPPPTRDNMPAPQPPPTQDNMPRSEPPKPRD